MIVNIPGDIQLIDKNSLRWTGKPDVARMFQRRIQEGLEWPTDNFIQANMVAPNKVIRLKNDSLRFLKTVLKNEWIAENLTERLIAVKGGMDGFDCFLARYEKDGYYIQMTIKKYHALFIFSSEDGSTHPFSPLGLKENALKCMEFFLTGFSEIEKLQWQVVDFDNFSMGYQIETKGDFSPWYETISWLTNGIAVRLKMRKTVKPVLLPKKEKVETRSEVKNWFGDINV